MIKSSPSMLLVLISLHIWISIVKGYEPIILSLRLRDIGNGAGDGKPYYDGDGQIRIVEGAELNLEIVSHGAQNETRIKFITEKMEMGEDCGNGRGSTARLETPELTIDKDDTVKIKSSDFIYSSHQSIFYVCAEVDNKFLHQGHKDKVVLNLQPKPFLPFWTVFMFLAFLLCLSGLFSGLNLGLMSLDQTELQILVKTGSDAEKNNANIILPIRSKGNFLLCTLLFGNVLVNVLIPMLMGSIPGADGPIAVIGSTFGIVVFGEIIPQALCSRHGLAVGAKTMILTKLFMLLTFPLSWPISKILDFILGEEIGTRYDRHRLIELLRMTAHEVDLDKKEVNILTGALVLKEKHVIDSMTPLRDCYLLPIDSILNFDTISEIKTKGYSRIPVYNGERHNIVHILKAKDLLFVDPDDEKPLEDICKFYDKPFIVTEGTKPMDKMLEEFRTGEKGHLALVKGGEDNEVVGLITLEDIIEEIIQAEIVDEDDEVVDNITRKKRKHLENRVSIKKDELKLFMDPEDKQIEVSPQVSLAVLQYLSSSIDKFNPTVIRPWVLKTLLSLDVFRIAKSDEYILKQGDPSDFFILIIEGKVEVQIGTEGYIFESGPFSIFGKPALDTSIGDHVQKKPFWMPECNVKPKGEVLYFALRSRTYLAAVEASKRENTIRKEDMEKEMAIMKKQQTEDADDMHEEATLLNKQDTLPPYS